ncbi:MFS transporter [Amycolatopsis sp. NPDC088138]|uniref:MFS transporter n=1 Tax=Amycolatopsis sp. NPDC088138 TaxID=3363938 RepID=UPI0037FC91B6
MSGRSAVTAGSRLWAPARLGPFRLLWLGQSLSLLGDGFSYVAFSWITLSLTGSTLALGYVLALQAIPRALLTLVGGSLADKWSPRRIMVLSSWARTAVMASVGLTGLTGTLSIGLLCAAAAAFGAVDAFFQPARMTVLPSVVAKDLLAPANALLGTGSRIAAMVGPAVGGVVVAVSDADVAFLVDALCFALCGLCVLGVRTRGDYSPARTLEPERMLVRIRAGLRYAWSDPRIRTILAIDAAVTFCYAGAFTVGFADLARFELSGGPTTLGVLNGALAAGAVLGGLTGGLVDGRPRIGLLIAALAGWLAVGTAVLGVVHNTVAAVATVLAMGFAIGFQGVFGLSWIQRTIDESVLSRVLSLDMVLGYAVAPISLVLCGALAQVHTALMFGGTALILGVTALGVLASPRVRASR